LDRRKFYDQDIELLFESKERRVLGCGRLAMRYLNYIDRGGARRGKRLLIFVHFLWLDKRKPFFINGYRLNSRMSTLFVIDRRKT